MLIFFQTLQGTENVGECLRELNNMVKNWTLEKEEVWKRPKVRKKEKLAKETV